MQYILSIYLPSSLRLVVQQYAVGGSLRREKDAILGKARQDSQQLPIYIYSCILLGDSII